MVRWIHAVRRPNIKRNWPVHSLQFTHPAWNTATSHQCDLEFQCQQTRFSYMVWHSIGLDNAQKMPRCWFCSRFFTSWWSYEHVSRSSVRSPMIHDLPQVPSLSRSKWWTIRMGSFAWLRGLMKFHPAANSSCSLVVSNLKEFCCITWVPWKCSPYISKITWKSGMKIWKSRCFHIPTL